MTDGEMKRFPNHTFGQAFTTLKCECLSYLPWLEKRYCFKFEVMFVYYNMCSYTLLGSVLRTWLTQLAGFDG